jgi:hypothetical protein
MSPRVMFALVMLGLLLLANLLMLNGYTNYPYGARREGFSNYTVENASPIGKNYVAIGTYDNVLKKPENGLSNWRGPAPNEPLLGPEPDLDNNELFMFANNQCKPECCGASFSCSGGCVCTTAKQRDFINTRGNNRNEPVDL